MSTSRRAGQHAGLSTGAVLSAARQIADNEGVERLTMRRLARELGVLPNALYSYVPDKEALLDALLDSLLGDIETDGLEALEWREGLTQIMDASRRLLLSHPGLVLVFLTRPGLGPNAARLGESTFALLRKGGVEDEPAVKAFRALLIFSLGFAAFQAPRLGNEARTEQGTAAFESLPQEEFPEMRRVAKGLARPPDDENFLLGLSWLLDGIEKSG